MSSRNSLRIVLVALLVLAGFLAQQLAQRAAARPLDTRGQQAVEKLLKDHEVLELDAASATQRVRESGRLSLSTSTRSFDLELTPYDLRAESYTAEEVVDGGAVRSVSMGPVHTFTGTVRGMEGALARFTLDEEKIEGVIITPGERYYIEPSRNFTASAGATEYLLYKGSDVIEGVHGSCAATMDGKLKGELERLAPRASDALVNATNRQVELATEADYEYVNYFGGSAAANTEILSIMNQVDGVFQKELGVSFKIVYQHTWTTSADPYSSTTSDGILNEFTDYWNANITHPRDLAHMWTDKLMDGGATAGIAWIGTICRDGAHAYGVSLRVLDGLKNSIAAHEIGHNFGATHPDQQSPPVAECAATLMNSTVGPVLDFCPFSLGQMSTYLSANSACLLNVSASPTVQFSAADYAVNEGAASALVTVTRAGDASGEVTVDYATANGTASDRTDYTAAFGTLHFAAGETAKTFSVLIVDDALMESSETINLTLSNLTGGAVPGNQSSATVTITDNDLVPPSTNPLDGPQFFVRQQYLDFLNREADSGGLDYWSGQLALCGTDAACLKTRPTAVSAAFFIESEFQETGYYVYRLYKAAYGRRPVFDEFISDRSRVVGSPSLDESKQALAAEFVGRAAFLAQLTPGMTPEQYVDSLNANTGSSLTQAERDALVSGLRSGTEVRATVLRKVAENQSFRAREYNAAFVLMQYFGYLRRDPDQAGYDFWLNVLNNREPNNFRGMVCSFITSAEYQRRFSSVVTRSNRDCSP